MHKGRKVVMAILKVDDCELQRCIQVVHMCAVTLYLGRVLGKYTALCVHWQCVWYPCAWVHGQIDT